MEVQETDVGQKHVAKNLTPVIQSHPALIYPVTDSKHNKQAFTGQQDALSDQND